VLVEGVLFQILSLLNSQCLQANFNAFPVIAWMAHDYLTLMGSSACIEQLFSASNKICSPDHSSLLPQTIESNLESSQLLQAGVPVPKEWAQAARVLGLNVVPEVVELD